MITKARVRGLLWAALMVIAAAGGTAQAQERGYLPTAHVREQVRRAKPVGVLPATQILHFDMLLPPANPRALDAFLADVYDPASANYRHFVTPAQFTDRFGPTQADWNELVNFARQQGFSIIGGSRDEMDLRLAAPVEAIEAAFHVKMRIYNHPTESRTFYSPDAEPSVDMKALVWHVSGLDNFSTPHARVHSRSATAPKPLTTTGGCPGNSYCGSDMRAAYYGGGALTGAGQSVGLVEFYGYDSADLSTYFTNAGQTNKVPVNGVSADGSNVTCLYSKGCDDTEQTLDITQVLGMAPGLAQLNVYVGASDTAILSAMSVPPAGSVTGKVDAQLSCSWGWGPADPATDDPLFKKFAAQGQTFFTAAGDSAAYGPASQYVFPADDANVTVVGGSDLSTAGPGGSWVYESAWSDGGGGFVAADNIAIPAWQTAALAAFNAQSVKPGSTTLRNSPDVAAEANFDFYVCANQKACTENMYGGTSFAAPMWAGYMALVNQQAALNGRTSIGFLNPTLYAIGNGAGSGYAQAFHDITAGSNGFAAVGGFDLATGWGSPNGAGLITALAGSSTPGFSLTSSGPVSVAVGASAAVTLTSSVTGGFNSGISLTATGQPNGVSVTFSPTSITGSGSSVVTFKVASTVAAGSYPITLTGTSSATGAGMPKAPVSTTVVLTVTVPSFSLSAAAAVTVQAAGTGTVAIQTTAAGGFGSVVSLTVSGLPAGVSAAFSPSAITGAGTSTLSVNVAGNAAAGVYPITVTGTSGTLVHSATVNLTVTVPGFSLTTGAGSLSVTQGLSATTSLAVAATGGFSSSVSLTASGQPAGVGVSFAPATISGSGSTNVTVTVAAGVATGTHPIVLTGTSGALKQSVTLIVNVGAAGISIAGAAPSLSVLQGASASMVVSTAVTGVLAAPISLTVSGQPTGVTSSLGASSITGSGSVTLTLAAGANVVAGSYPITISAVSGSATGKFTLTLVVAAVSRPTYVFGVGTTALTVTHGTSGTFTVQTALTGTTAPSVALTAGGLPAGVAATFSAPTINGAGVSTVTVSAASSAKPGTATLTFTAAAGSAAESATVILTIN